MMKEKVSVQIAPNALKSILNLLNVIEHPTTESKQLVFELLSGEAKVFRYPQKNEALAYLGILFQHEDSKKVVQLVVELGDTITVIDALVDAKVNGLTDYFDVDITFTPEVDYSFSSNFIANFYELKMEQQHVAILEQLESWSNYIEFLLRKLEKQYTIQSIEKITDTKYNVYFHPEKALYDLKIEAGESLVVDYAFYNETIATVSEWDAEQCKLVVTTNQALLNYLEQEVRIQHTENYERLFKNSGDVRSILQQERKIPSIHHPILNPLYPVSPAGKFYGYTTKEADVSSALEQLMTLAETQTEKMVVVLERPEIENVLVERYREILPINSKNEKQDSIVSVKEPIKEKSSIKYKELENAVSEAEVAVQKRAIQNMVRKIEAQTSNIEKFEEVQRYLSAESTKNTNKMNAFHTLIASYEEEQEQLAFQNDQLIQSKQDLENSIKDQQLILEEILTKEKEEKLFFENLEEDWLTFNKESTIYTEYITTNKNMAKSESIIEECLEKMKLITDEIKMGDDLQQSMQTEFEAFKENQQVEKVDQLIVRMKATAHFLDTPIDLQFANSYAELTHIYMEKFLEIEALEERLSSSEQMIKEELQSNQLHVSMPQSSHYNFDRHYTEEKMANVINLIERKPLTIGINFKAKQKWKETFEEAVEDLYRMLFSMKSEKTVLEKKLMAQLDYAEQLLQYFDNDIKHLNAMLEDQQISLRSSEAEYQAIIDAANLDIKTMQQNIEQGIQSTKGRSKNYTSLTELENKRKSFKAELLTKYEGLELQVNEIERATEFIRKLEEKHSEKVEEVLQDKREMNIQIDVLQHDIVNSKAAIEKLKQENQLINTQYEEIVKQIQLIQLEMDSIEERKQQITTDLSEKELTSTQNKKMITVMKKWHEQLDSAKTSSSWKKYIDQNSKLRFHTSSAQVKHQFGQTVFFEDQQFSWIDIVSKLKQQSNAFFVTTDISQRQLIELQAFEDYLEMQGKSVLQRNKTLEQLKENPFSKFAQAYERVETPYLVQENQKTSFM